MYCQSNLVQVITLDKKKCPKCKQVLALCCFAKKRNSVADECRSCHSIYNRQHYEKRKEYYLEKANRWKKGRKKIITDLKASMVCSECGGKFPPASMDFHHRGGEEKKFNIGSYGTSVSLEVLMEEISKCDLMCSNCHRAKTYSP